MSEEIESNEELAVDVELEAMIEHSKKNGIEITDAYIENLRDSKEDADRYKAAYPEANRIMDNIAKNISTSEAEEIVEILKRGNPSEIEKLTDGLIDLFG